MQSCKYKFASGYLPPLQAGYLQFHLFAAMCCLPGLTLAAEGMHVQDPPDQMLPGGPPCLLASKLDVRSWRRLLG